MGGRLAGLNAALATTRTSIEALAGPVDAIVGKLGEVRTAVDTDVPAITSRLDELKQEGGTKLDDFLIKLEESAEQGNVVATSMLEVINAFLQGTISTEKAVNAFADGTLQDLDGTITTIRDKLLDLLPSQGQVQRQIQEFIANASGYEELLQRLQQSSSGAARAFAELFRQLQQGRGTLENLIQEAQRLKQGMPGSETAQIADALIDQSALSPDNTEC